QRQHALTGAAVRRRRPVIPNHRRHVRHDFFERHTAGVAYEVVLRGEEWGLAEEVAREAVASAIFLVAACQRLLEGPTRPVRHAACPPLPGRDEAEVK